MIHETLRDMLIIKPLHAFVELIFGITKSDINGKIWIELCESVFIFFIFVYNKNKLPLKSSWLYK